MNLKIILTATRPDTSADFWYNIDHGSLTSESNTLDLALSNLGIQQTTTTSSDGLTLTKTYTNLTDTAWNDFMAVVFSLTASLADRNNYFNTHGHTLVLTKIDADTNATVETISNAVVHTSR